MNSTEAHQFAERLAIQEPNPDEMDVFLDYLRSVERKEAELIMDVYVESCRKNPTNKIYVSEDFMDRLSKLSLPGDISEEGVSFATKTTRMNNIAKIIFAILFVGLIFWLYEIFWQSKI